MNRFIVQRIFGAFPLRDYPLFRRTPDHLEITTSAEGSLSLSYSPK
jgi:hypothetical protein